MSATTLRVELDTRSYDICIGPGLIEDAGARIAPLLSQPRAVVITDSNVGPLYLDRLTASLDGAGIKLDAIQLPAGEGTKSFANLETVIDRLLEMRVERSTTLIALGGGVIGDLTGFAAAITLRGMPFIQVPTSLLAQVDSSVGGKTGINTSRGKNLVGAFHQPQLVLADTNVLDTLDRRQLLAGYGEVVKYGLIDDMGFFAWLEDNGQRLIDGDADLRTSAVLTSCEAKARVVAADELEQGTRALLNLGHTFGHVLEAETGYSDALLHGEAVAIGMVMAFELSARMGLCPQEDADRVKAHLSDVGLPVDLSTIRQDTWTSERLMDHMSRDKKVKDGKLTFILARGIGQSFLTRDVDQDRVAALFEEMLNT